MGSMLPHCFIGIQENGIKQMPISCSTSFDNFYTIKGYRSNTIETPLILAFCARNAKTSSGDPIFFIIELQSAYKDSPFFQSKNNSPK